MGTVLWMVIRVTRKGRLTWDSLPLSIPSLKEVFLTEAEPQRLPSGVSSDAVVFLRGFIVELLCFFFCRKRISNACSSQFFHNEHLGEKEGFQSLLPDFSCIYK
jgi:hypothetical protein